jgi:Translationally controlled tumour protein
MKAVKTKLTETKPERVDAFEKGAAAYAKKIIANFKDYEFVRQQIYSQPSISH